MKLHVQLEQNPPRQVDLSAVTNRMIERQYKWKEEHIERALCYFQVNLEDIPLRVRSEVNTVEYTEEFYIDNKRALTFLGGEANYLAIHHYRK